MKVTFKSFLYTFVTSSLIAISSEISAVNLIIDNFAILVYNNLKYLFFSLFQHNYICFSINIGRVRNRTTIGYGVILHEKISRKYEINFVFHAVSFLRKPSLKICKVYSNLGKRVNNQHDVIIHVKINKKCEIFFRLRSHFQESKV